MSPCTQPINLKSWIEEHRRLLKPPVGNRVVLEERDLSVQVLAGPITRKDYHINPTEELYYQLEGDLTLRCIDAQGKVSDQTIRAGELYLLPANTPHAELRPAGSVGLVIERSRPTGEDDHLRFYCDKCGSVVYDEQFEAADIAEQVRDTLERFWSDATLRTCVQCGLVIQHGGGPAAPAIAQTTPVGARSTAERATKPLAGSRAAGAGGSRPSGPVRPSIPSRSPMAHAKKRAVVGSGKR